MKSCVQTHQQRKELVEQGKGKDLLPISFYGGWISPIEKGYGALMTTDLWPEQEPEKAAQAIQLLFGSLHGHACNQKRRRYGLPAWTSL